jgi:hypothetical protein
MRKNEIFYFKEFGCEINIGKIFNFYYLNYLNYILYIYIYIIFLIFLFKLYSLFIKYTDFLLIKTQKYRTFKLRVN